MKVELFSYVDKEYSAKYKLSMAFSQCSSVLLRFEKRQHFGLCGRDFFPKRCACFTRIGDMSYTNDTGRKLINKNAPKKGK
jgi:hypothetical protein